MTIQLSFLTAVVLAGMAYLLGQSTVRRVPLLQRYYVPEPLFGGFVFALGFLLLRGADLRVEFPTKGGAVDFLVALLTTNMGLHITPNILRQGYRLFLLFLGAGVVLYFVQLLLVLPVALLDQHPLRTAILAGPLSFVGAPFNLNPPDQTAPLEQLFQIAYPNLKPLAQGVMMLGVITAIFVAGFVGRLLFQRPGEKPPKPSPSDREAHMALSRFAIEETELIVLILTLIAVAFSVQQFLLQVFPRMQPDYLPVIVLSFLFGGTFRLGFTMIIGQHRFPEQALTVVLLGPTMSLVFAYAVMSIPLHYLALLTPRLIIGAVLAICGSVGVAWFAFSVFARYTDRYYASVVATAFLAITTGWGPIGMGFLRRFIDEEGPVEPMPVIMPLNAFYIFPWMVILITRLLLRLLG